MKKTFTFWILLLTFLISYDSYSLSGFQNNIPNGQKNSCLNCHFTAGGGGARNAFGQAYKNNNYQWNEILAALDSDNDSFTNGQELQDPNGVWRNTDPNSFGDPSLVTLPGNANDFPSSIENDDFYSKLSIYPLPVIENINIKLEAINGESIEVKIYDYYGNLVNQHNVNLNGNSIDLSLNREDNKGNRLPSGVYFIEISNDFIIQKQKFIIE